VCLQVYVCIGEKTGEGKWLVGFFFVVKKKKKVFRYVLFHNVTRIIAPIGPPCHLSMESYVSEQSTVTHNSHNGFEKFYTVKIVIAIVLMKN
jgi:hypothetical protein